MLSLPDLGAMQNALTLPLRDDIKDLLRKRIDQIIDDGLDDLTHIVVLCSGDTEAMLKSEVLFSPLEREGVRFDQPGFETYWDWLHDHGGWFELIYCIADSGFAFLLFLEDRDDEGWADLLQMCRTGCGRVGGGGGT
jgi:hypothetical protein